MIKLPNSFETFIAAICAAGSHVVSALFLQIAKATIGIPQLNFSIYMYIHISDTYIPRLSDTYIHVCIYTDSTVGACRYGISFPIEVAAGTPSFAAVLASVRVIDRKAWRHALVHVDTVQIDDKKPLGLDKGTLGHFKGLVFW